MPWRPWRPSLKQEKFLSLPLSVKEGFYAGAAGAGKSDVLLMYPIVHQWIDDPNFKGLFLRRTVDELRDEIIPRSKTKLEFDRYGGKWIGNPENVWRFKSGAFIKFGHCQFEDDVHRYDTSQWNYIAFDELTSFIEFQYIYLVFERVRKDLASPNLPAIARSASNPGNIGHAWVRRRFISPAPHGGKIIEGKGGNKRIFIPATLNDNPYIDPDYSKSLDGLPEAERQAKKFGNWDAYSGQVFDEFRDHKYPDEPDNAIHVIDPFDIPEWWPRICAIDWGYRAMTWVGFAAISPQRRLYLYREIGFTAKKIEEWAPYVKAFDLVEKFRIIKLCKSAGQDRGQEHTIQQQVGTALGRNVELTSNNPGSRVAGKQLLHEYFRWRQKFIPIKEMKPFSEEHATWIYRNQGPDGYARYMESFQPTAPEDNIPKLQIFRMSPEGSPNTLVIEAIKSCAYDKTNTEDVAEFEGDDPYDGLRYLVDTADKFFNDASNEFKKVEEQNKIAEDFKRTGDWNVLYRRVEVLEKTNTSVGKMQGVRRYSHGVR